MSHVPLWNRSMLVYTDSIGYGEDYLQGQSRWRPISRVELDEPIRELAARLFSGQMLHCSEMTSFDPWRYLLLVEHAEESQFDVLTELSSSAPELPSGILCCAGSGKNFHGFKSRPWVAVPGNLHLSVYLRPGREIEGSGVAFIVLAVVSVLETLDSLGMIAGKPMVKWVNDILIGGSKLGGVLAHVQTQAKTVTSAVLGIGLNLQAQPVVSPTPFVPKVAALSSFVENLELCSPHRVLNALAHCLDHNYEMLVTHGFSELLDAYRERSLVIGEVVTIYEDSIEKRPREIARGRVESIGRGLELFLEGVEAPVCKGRLAL
jgi:biotin-[acetyl-CoA-carboxylase] ligase BirA-like protein